MSIRTILPEISSFGTKWSPSPISEPTISTASAAASAVWLAPLRKEQPIESAWLSGSTPLPALEASTGAPIRSATRARSGPVPTAPPPTTISGAFAAARSAPASAISAGFGSGFPATRRAFQSAASPIGRGNTFQGSDR